jgi:hypothetical protein
MNSLNDRFLLASELMHMRTWLHLTLVAVVLLVAVAFLLAWRSARQDNARLQVQLHEAGQALEQATAAQQQRGKQLALTLARLNSLKSTVKSRQDILKGLPDVLTLPKPLMASAANDDGQPSTRAPKLSKPESPQPQPIAVPPEDLKPLLRPCRVDRKACQAKLAAASDDLADEKTKTQVLSRERDAALQAARGGSLRQRIKRSAKWFLLGVVAGAVAAKAH